MFIVKKDFLWFKKKEQLKDEEVKENWIEEKLVEKSDLKSEDGVNLDMDKDGDLDDNDKLLAGRAYREISKKIKKKKSKKKSKKGE